jgi:uncharacterized protein (DUF58 family)
VITRAGWLLAAGTSILALLAVFSAYPQAVVLSGAGAGALLAALLLTRVPEVEVTCAWVRPRVSEGTTAILGYRLVNRSRRRAAGQLVNLRVAGEERSLPVPALGGGAVHQGFLDVAGLHRGRHQADNWRVQQVDPLGLVRRVRVLDGSADIVVHPRTARLGRGAPGLGTPQEGRTHDGGRRGAGSFHALREYQPGDDLRFVHWASTARTGQLVVRDVVVPDVNRHIVLLDVSAASYPGALFEEAVRVSASLALAASRLAPVWLVTTAGDVTRFGPHRSGSPTSLLDRLALVTAEGPGGPPMSRRALGDLTSTSVTVVTGNGGAVLADPRRWSRLREAAGLVVVAMVPGPPHRDLDRAGQVRVEVADLDSFAALWSTPWQR